MNKEQAYDANISPLMAQIIEHCKEHNIAMLATFAIPVPEDDGLCCTTILPDETGGRPDGIKSAAIALSGGSPLMLTTRNADGKVVNMTAVLP